MICSSYIFAAVVGCILIAIGIKTKDKVLGRFCIFAGIFNLGLFAGEIISHVIGL